MDGGTTIAHVDDRWVKNGVRTPQYGKGMRYRARYIDPQGNERSRSFPDKQKRAAEAFLNDIESKKLHNEYTDPKAGKVTFREYSTGWLAQTMVGEASRSIYERALRLQVYPTLGDVSLANITTALIRTWLAEMKRQQVAATSVRNIKAIISSVLNAAVDDGCIARNPCKAQTVKAPKVEAKKVIPWADSRVAAVRSNLQDRYRAMVDVGVGIGLRQGEVFGLSIDDIDEGAGVVYIRRQVRLRGGPAMFALPKHNKTRTVPLSEPVLVALKAHMAQFRPLAITLPWGSLQGKPTTVRLFFTTTMRNVVKRNTFNEKIWVPTLKRAGVEAVRENGMHALRHYYASISLAGGVSVKELAEYMGHSDPGFTLRVYTHLLPSSPDRARLAVAEAFQRLTLADDGLVTA